MLMEVEDPYFQELMQSKGEDDPLYLSEFLEFILKRDDKEKLVAWLNEGLSLTRLDDRLRYRQLLPKALFLAIQSCAVRCSAALLNGNISNGPSFIKSINNPIVDGWSDGWTPLHEAASCCCPCIIELLLYHKARTDLLAFHYESDVPQRNLKIPLDIAFDAIRYTREVRWTPYQSIFQLVIALCLPVMQDKLETVELLAWQTKEIEERFMYYIRMGNVPVVAAMLVTAREKLHDSAQTIQKRFLTKESSLCKYSGWMGDLVATFDYKKEVRMRLLELLEIFDKAGDEIEEYVKREKFGVTTEQVIAEVIELLHQAGFDLKSQKIDFSRFRDFECRPRPKDFNMPHYSFSGRRWTEQRLIEMRKAIAEKPKPVGSVSSEQPSPMSCVPVASEQQFPMGVPVRYYSGFSFDHLRARRGTPMISFPLFKKTSPRLFPVPSRSYCLVLSAVGKLLRRI